MVKCFLESNVIFVKVTSLPGFLVGLPLTFPLALPSADCPRRDKFDHNRVNRCVQNKTMHGLVTLSKDMPSIGLQM